MATDYYKVLGVERSATQDAIKGAYRKLARKLHPDLNPDDKEAKKKFQEINEANEVLGDPESRKKYDVYGENWKHGEQYEQAQRAQRAQAPGGGGARSAEGMPDDFADMFGSMFGGRGGRQAKFRGQDYNAEVQLAFLEAYRTHKQTLSVNGKQIRITVPAGVRNDQTIRIEGHGGPGMNGGPNGDLFITFSIGEHPRFKRAGNDLYTTVDIDLYTAVLGGDLTLETLDGTVKLAVKPETPNGAKVKLKGKGFPIYKHEDAFGDLFVTYNVNLPKDLSEEQRDLFRKLAATAH